MIALAYYSSAYAINETWRNEFVGRMQLQLPGGVDVAVQRIEDIIKGGQEPKYQFEDGEAAPFSTAAYAGNVNISGELTDSEAQLMTDAQARWLERSRELGKTAKNLPPG